MISLKKGLVVALLATFVAGGLFAQEAGKSETKKAMNTITGGLVLGVYSGASLDYERMFTKNWGAGVEVGYGSFLFLLPALWVDAQAKFYPWGKRFYADVAVGYAQWFYVVPAFLVGGGVGWKFDIGKPNGFVLDVGVGMDYYILMETKIAGGLIDAGGATTGNPKATIQIGYSF